MPPIPGKGKGVIEIVRAEAAGQLAAVGRLFAAHAAALIEHPGSEQVLEDAARLPGPYGPPRGGLYLARLAGVPAGCVALRPLDDSVGEVKRMFVLAEARRHGLARALMERLLADAAALHYRTIRLGTLEAMTAAQALYRSMGFRRIPRYHDQPTVDQVFYQLVLPAPD